MPVDFRAATEDFIESGTLAQLQQILEAAIADGGANALASVQKCYEHMYGGFTFNMELKAPSAWSLVAFGEPGLQALVEGAKRTPTSKNESLTLQILSYVACKSMRSPLAPSESEPLGIAIKNCLTDELARSARAILRAYVTGLPADRAEFALGWGLQALSMHIGTETNPAQRQLFAASALRWLTIDQPSIAEFERLILQKPDEEPAFQDFLALHPQFLDPMAVTVWDRPSFHGAHTPDFVLRRADETYVVVEIETPGKLLMTSGRPPQCSAECTHAESQIIEYRRFLNTRLHEVRHAFPNFSHADGLVVVGLERGLSSEQREALAATNETKHGIRVVGFDWLLKRAEAVRENLIHADLEVKKLRLT